MGRCLDTKYLKSGTAAVKFIELVSKYREERVFGGRGGGKMMKYILPYPGWNQGPDLARLAR